MLARRFLQTLLFPLALLYGTGVSIHHFFYKSGLLKSISFSLPIISIGNLSIGGAGKTPHVEYLILLLKDYVNVATLSRGYKRKTRGFQFVHPSNNAEEVGDEPLQYKRKFIDILVTVAESRVMAIPEILKSYPETQVVLLDDAFQHRPIQPGLNILLTEYSHPFTRDYLLPSGRLREWRSSYERADVIVVSKCPNYLEPSEQEKWQKELQPFPHQKIFFSYYNYGVPYYIFNSAYRVVLRESVDVLLVCAIARSEYLLSYLKEQVNAIVLMEFEDHHYFTNHDISTIRATFERMESNQKIIITTEKDAMRLDLHRSFLIEHQLPVYVLPVQVQFHFEQSAEFEEIIKQFLLNFRI